MCSNAVGVTGCTICSSRVLILGNIGATNTPQSISTLVGEFVIIVANAFPVRFAKSWPRLVLAIAPVVIPVTPLFLTYN